MNGRTKSLLALAVVTLLSCLPAEASSPTDEDIVGTFFPAEMKRGVQRHHLHARWSRASLDGAPGDETIVAIYTNGKVAAVTVIAATEGAVPRVVSTFHNNEMTGLAARLELLDLDHDDIPEIGALLAAAGGNSRTWLFKWSHTGLNVFGPTVPGHRDSRVTVLGDPLFVDINGDGSRDVINFPDDEMTSGNPADVYLLRDGSFVPADFKVVFYDVVVERGQRGEVAEVSIPIQDVTAAYAVSLVNGDERGRNLVATADVTINGKRVRLQKAANGLSSTSPPMQLNASNIARVSLAGSPESHVRLFVHTASPPPTTESSGRPEKK